jgi:nucleoside-diphosphate-sugar epimerase
VTAQTRDAGGRRRPTRRRGPVVAVTGAAAPVGAAIAAALARRQGAPTGPSGVVAVDEVRGALDGVTWRLGDVTDPSVVERLAGADIVVHVADRASLEQALAVPARQRRMREVRAVQAVTTAAAAAGASRLIVVTSAMVYGARADNPVPLPEDAPLRAEPDDGLVGDLLEVERIVARTPRVHPGLRVAVVRPAALVGAGVDTVVTRHFEAPRLLSVRGADTRWQFCHLDDLAEAVTTAVEAGLDGPLTVGCDEALTWADVEELVGLRRLELPSGLAYATAERLHRLGMLPMPPGDLSLVVHPWVVSAQRLRDAGWAPQHTNDDCIRLLLETGTGQRAVVGRRLDRRDAALGAAGAAVALVATAAIVRQARSRRARRRRPTL